MRFLLCFVLLFSSVFSDIIDMSIFHTTDIHGNMFPYRDPVSGKKIGSFASMVPILQKKRAEGLPVLFFDSGDIIQGTYEDKISKGQLVSGVMNSPLLNYTLRTLGNHAFDYGLQTFRDVGVNVQFPIVVSNLKSDQEGFLDFTNDYYFVESGGFRFGVFGLLTVGTPAAQFAENVAGISFLPEKDYLLTMPNKLRAMGADFVVLMAHLGLYDDRRPSRPDLLAVISSLPQENASNIDLVFDGHSHIKRFEKMPKENPDSPATWFLQSGCYGEFLGELKLKICNESNSIVHAEGVFHDLDVTTNPEDAEFLKANRRDMVEAIKISGKRIATTDLGFILPHDRFHPFHQGLTTFAVVQSFYEYAHQDGVEVDFACAASRGVRFHLASHAGKISRADVHRVCPFENKLVYAKIKGSDFLNMLKNNGRRLSYYGLEFVLSKEEHEKKNMGLEPLEIYVRHSDGRREPFQANRIYTVAMQDYLAQAMDFEFTDTLYDLHFTGITDQNILAWFLGELSKQRRAEGRRISVADFSPLIDRHLRLK